MTLDQEKQFDDYGCTCRCLIALANANGQSITKKWFIDTFSQKPRFKFWNNNQKCGVTDTSMVLDIACELGLAKSFQIFLNKDKVRENITHSKVSGILLFTEKKEEKDGSLSDYFHCNLIGSKVQANDSFQLIQVNEKIQAGPATPLTDSDIDRLKGYFLLLS